MLLKELSLPAKLRAYKAAKRYVVKEFPDLCKTEKETKEQAYDEARQYGIEFGYDAEGYEL